MVDRLPVPAVTRAVQAVAEAFDVKAQDVRGRRRFRCLYVPRAVAIGMLRMTDRMAGERWSMPMLGRHFDRDHTTILHAIRSYLAMCEAQGLNPEPGDFDERARALASAYAVSVSDAAQRALAAPLPANPAVRPARSSMPAATPDEGTSMPDTATPEPRAPDEFGSFRLSLDAWQALPAAMQAEAARLAVERAGSIEAASRATGLSLRILATAFGDTPAPHDLPRINEATWRPEDEARAPAAAPQVDGRFLAFAQIHLSGEGRLDVPAAYATYRAFCAGRGCDPLPRSSFGAALLAMARGHGGRRTGDTILGLSLRDGRPAPPLPAPESGHTAVRSPRAPLVLGIAGRPKGRRIIEITEDGERLERREGVS